MMGDESRGKQVLYDGEYVLNHDGSKNFGEIPPEIARKIKRQAVRILENEDHQYLLICIPLKMKIFGTQKLE